MDNNKNNNNEAKFVIGELLCTWASWELTAGKMRANEHIRHADK